jgi:hypothetical protein
MSSVACAPHSRRYRSSRGSVPKRQRGDERTPRYVLKRSRVSTRFPFVTEAQLSAMLLLAARSAATAWSERCLCSRERTPAQGGDRPACRATSAPAQSSTGPRRVLTEPRAPASVPIRVVIRARRSIRVSKKRARRCWYMSTLTGFPEELERQLQLVMLAIAAAARRAIARRQQAIAGAERQSEAAARARLEEEHRLAAANLQAVFDDAWWQTASAQDVASKWQQATAWRDDGPPATSRQSSTAPRGASSTKPGTDRGWTSSSCSSSPNCNASSTTSRRRRTVPVTRNRRTTSSWSGGAPGSGCRSRRRSRP